MKRIFDTLKSNILFQGIEFSDFDKMLNCLSAKTRTYKKDEIILLSGDPPDHVGLVLRGSVRIVKEDLSGRTAIMAELGVSETFAEVFACAGVAQSPVTVMAACESEVLLMDYRRVISACTAACPFHAKLIENMLRLLAQKNLMLNTRCDILSKRTTREKLLAFFDTQRGASKKFSIPFGREELAQYLCVDRSAMSGELGRMRDDGILTFERNRFELLDVSRNLD